MSHLLFGEVRERLVGESEIRRTRQLMGALFALVALFGLALGALIPRSLTYGALVEENLRLRTHLQALDQQMGEVDRALMRLRLYESQIRSAGTPTGPYGPVDEEELTWVPGTSLELLQELGDVQPLEYHPSDLHPAEAWALAVQARADVFLEQFAAAEPDMQQMMAEVEDLKALERALPSRWPATGRLTSTFGFRKSPVRPYRTRFHSGIDIANRRGAPIVAVAPGQVIDVSWRGGYGKVVELAHGYGITTVYAHCQATLVREGQRVEAGDRVATIGNTGRSTGPHLHFEVRVDGHAVDPMDYLPR
ncbi:MAG: M23 family metallopeptidase [Deltaproteobacteria bacterium]|nr:M23 family metallopeptidase [Deltaproteobacteria bacterium]